MALEVVSASLMTSDETRHIARCVGDGSWVVSWLPGRTLSAPQAVTAMTIASAVATGGADGAGELDAAAAELGLTGREAVFLIAVENHDYGTQRPRPRPRR
ncbi:hypothetical protein [Nocardia asteroides]|uniref:hypothetical protein n=1 Tax=Nocardia asteroides TaxID=1824 RepID=UPI001E3195F5|nr:hypothetical protein [Nocardia asteroides]UGT63722.1 hypothetical protein LTT61_10600 [Nocardia asteroides]